eukprot:6490496-Prymnesium_polylepis.2
MVPPTFASAPPPIVSDEVVELQAPRLDPAASSRRTRALVARGHHRRRDDALKIEVYFEALTRERELQLLYRPADPPSAPSAPPAQDNFEYVQDHAAALRIHTAVCRSS